MNKRLIFLALIFVVVLWQAPLAIGSPVSQEPPRQVTEPTNYSDASSAPFSDEEIEVKRGDQVVKVRQIRTVKLSDGREAAADRLIVGFKDGVDDSGRADAHQKAQGNGLIAAKALQKLGPSAEIVDVTGAASLEDAIKIYEADPRVRYAEPDFQV